MKCDSGAQVPKAALRSSKGAKPQGVIHRYSSYFLNLSACEPILKFNISSEIPGRSSDCMMPPAFPSPDSPEGAFGSHVKYSVWNELASKAAPTMSGESQGMERTVRCFAYSVHRCVPLSPYCTSRHMQN
jgi:hypothetical protein